MTTISIDTALLRAHAGAMRATARTVDGATIPMIVDLGRSTGDASQVLSDLEERSRALAGAIRSFATNLALTANDFEEHEDLLVEKLHATSNR